MLVSDVHFPKDLAEAFGLLKEYPDALVWAGGTDILREQGAIGLDLPRRIVCVDQLPELRKAGLTERFLEIGAAVTVAEVLELGETAIPPLLSDALKGIGNPAIRNLATLGGNLACPTRFMDAWPALACLDALVEFRDQGGAAWFNVNRFVGEWGAPAIPRGGLITRVRVPLERWDAVALWKIGQSDYPSPDTAVFAFAARVDKGLLTEFRLAFAGTIALRIRSLETRIIGRSLPLSGKERLAFGQEYRSLAETLPPGQAQRFGSLVDGALDMLAG
ncbi:MAG: FAD binding domain-containing protein [Spirochaetaceae bacterium]|nr:FAD binding domain-containing protein [Spirochaetaceae bacterium]